MRTLFGGSASLRMVPGSVRTGGQFTRSTGTLPTQINNKMKTLIKSINPSPLRCGFFTLAIALWWFALSPPLKAVDCPNDCSGAFGNTGLGINALDSVNGGAGGINNTAVGQNALTADTIGYYNVAIGSGALASNTSGNFNMAIGAEALKQNNGDFNLAIGFRVGFMNTTGSSLTGIGAAALRNNTTGSNDTAIGANAMRENSIGDDNTAIGSSALSTNVQGNLNAAVGFEALMNNSTGFHNTACGAGALLGNTTGAFNIAVGSFAGANLTTGYDNIDVGSAGFAGEHDTIRIGSTNGIATFIDGIYGVVAGGPTLPVYVNSGGQLSTNTSSRRFKKEIKPMDRVSEAILALKPVTFHYKTDSKGTPQFGLIAEEVAEVNPDLVVRDKEGKPYSVRYDQINAMLLNEFLKEHRKVERQDRKAQAQQEEIDVLKAELKEQKAQIQKVNARLV